MYHVRTITYSFIILLFSLVSAHAEEILMIKWMANNLADKAFEKQIKKLRPHVKIRSIVAHRDKKKLVKQLRKYDLSKTKLVYTLGTTATKIASNYLKGQKPIVFNLVSTPVLSNIADSIEKPGRNITGAKLLINLNTFFKLLKKVKKINNLAVWYDPRERQSGTIIKSLSDLGWKNGIIINPVRIIPDAQNFDELIEKAKTETKNYEALYLVLSASFYKHSKKLYGHFPKEVPVITTIRTAVGKGATLSFSTSFYERSVVVANMANQILNGAKAGEIPINVASEKETILYVDKKKAAKLGLRKLDQVGIKVEYVE